MTRIEKIKALCEAATKGPWVDNDRFVGTSKENDDILSGCHFNENEARANAHLIAQSRELVPELISLVEVMAGALDNIAKSPDLPNPDRDADWKNCQKWSSYEAKAALAKYKAWNEGE